MTNGIWQILPIKLAFNLGMCVNEIDKQLFCNTDKVWCNWPIEGKGVNWFSRDYITAVAKNCKNKVWNAEFRQTEESFLLPLAVHPCLHKEVIVFAKVLSSLGSQKCIAAFSVYSLSDKPFDTLLDVCILAKKTQINASNNSKGFEQCFKTLEPLQYEVSRIHFPPSLLKVSMYEFQKR